MSRIGVVGIPDGWSSLRLVAAFEAQGADACLIDMAQVVLDANSGAARHGDQDLGSFDALVIKKIGSPYAPQLLDRLALLRHVAERGTPVFSDPARIKRVLGRLSCTITLGLAGIPMPPTVMTEDVDLAVEAVRRFGRAVLKPLYTSKARGMVVVENNAQTGERVRAFQQAGNRMLYVQKLLALPGRDLGVAFLGGECIGCYARVGGEASWNTTTRSGGRYEPHEPSREVVDLARRAQAPFGLDFTCVDVALSEQGLVVFEVSAFGGFRGLWEAASIDAAQLCADYVLRRLAHG